MSGLVRINTRISSKLNEWLDKESKETGMSKSTIVMLAVEGYRKEKDAMEMMVNMQGLSMVMEELEEIKKALPNEK